MAKHDQILDEGLLAKKGKKKSSFTADLVNILIGMAVMILFIGALVFAIGALLK